MYVPININLGFTSLTVGESLPKNSEIMRTKFQRLRIFAVLHRMNNKNIKT